MSKQSVRDDIDLYINHALFHHNDGTWTVRSAGITDDGRPFTFQHDVFVGNHPTAEAALKAHQRSLHKRFPGWFKP